MIIIKQLISEFWFPLLTALLWTAYNFSEIPRDQWTLRLAVNVCGPTFFFASWLISQWYRVRKQQKVESGLTSIEASVNNTLSELETKTSDLVGHITGGESFCYLQGLPSPSGALTQLFLVHVGKHPLYDVAARVVDLEAFRQIREDVSLESLRKVETHRQLGSLIPGHSAMLFDDLLLISGVRKDFNVFFTARNGSFVQLLRFRKVGDAWVYATKVFRGELSLHEEVQQGFPRTIDNAVEW